MKAIYSIYPVSEIIKYPCEGVSDEDTEKAEKLANAAPELLKACNMARMDITKGTADQLTINVLEDAIKKSGIKGD